MIHTTLHEIKTILSLPTTPEDARQRIDSITLDSRTPGTHTLFIALEGERIDSHRFVKELLESGKCVAALVDRTVEVEPQFAERLLNVTNTLDAFRLLMQKQLESHPAKRIVVGGSVGKTSAKEMLRALLAGRFKTVLATVGSENGYLGIPKTLARLEPETEVVLLEVGIDEPGAMQAHMDLIHPHAGLLTAIGPEHLEKLQTLERVAHEERFLFKALERTNGVRIVNLDDPHLAAEYDPKDSKIWGFTLSDSATSKGPRVFCGELDPNGTLHVRVGDQFFGRFSVPLPGTHQAQNLLGALTLCHAFFGMTADEFIQGLATFQGAKGRTEVRPSQKHSFSWLLDHYNASPESVRAALKTLQTLANGTRTHLVLGDMLELGTDELRYHAELAPHILALPNLASIHLYGPRMQTLAHELGSRCTSYSKDAHTELAACLRPLLKNGDWVLLKGSRGMKMERVFEALEGALP